MDISKIVATVATVGVRQTGEILRADGEPLQLRSLTQQFTKLRDGVKGLPRVRLHDTRHTHATQLLADGVHPKVAQERLGHSTITTTMDLRHGHDAGRCSNEA